MVKSVKSIYLRIRRRYLMNEIAKLDKRHKRLWKELRKLSKKQSAIPAFRVLDHDSQLNKLLLNTRTPVNKFINTIHLSAFFTFLIYMACEIMLFWALLTKNKQYEVSILIIAFVLLSILVWGVKSLGSRKRYEKAQQIYNAIKRSKYDLNYISYLLKERIAETKQQSSEFWKYFTFYISALGISTLFLGKVRNVIHSFIVHFEPDKVISLGIVLILILIPIIICGEFLNHIINDKGNLVRWKLLAENVERVKFEKEK